jgi:hypothetical protein
MRWQRGYNLNTALPMETQDKRFLSRRGRLNIGKREGRQAEFALSSNH